TTSDALGHTGTSLRDAVGIANADGLVGQSTNIIFDPSLAGSTITLVQGQLLLSSPGAGIVTIDGTSLSTPVTISGNNSSRVLLVKRGVHAALNGLTISGGLAPTTGGSNTGTGGGISTAGTLVVTKTAISGNSAGQAGNGGGIFNSGSLSVINS